MKKRTIKIILALLIFASTFILPFPNDWLPLCFYVFSYLIVGAEIVWKAIRNILRGKVLDENFLMTVATLGAFVIGEFPEAVAVMLFYQIGELFQSYAVDKSRKSITSLMDIRPDFAHVKHENKLEKVSPDEVKINDFIVVKPGEKIPLDGTIVEGNSMLDTSSLTGESLPKYVSLGDEVLSGCINQNGLLTIQVTKEFGESTVSKILDLVENASSKKSKSENFISKFAKYYTPIVVVIALLLAFIPPLFLGFSTFSNWLYRALSFLVVSCPCALVISIPLSFFGGIGGASKLGILVKGSNYLEALSHVETIVFDKTGTLTEGVFEVQKIEAIGMSKEELLRLTAHAESYSNHPISQSVKKAYAKDLEMNLISKTEELAGLGVFATIENKNLLVGNERLMLEKQISYEKCTELGTVLYIAIDGNYAGYALALGIGFLTSAVNVFFKDMAQIVSICLQFGMWLTPIMYHESMFEEKAPWAVPVLKLNPFYYISTGYRDSMLMGNGFWERPKMTLYFWGVTLAVGLIGLKVFKRLRPHFSDVL